jgi:hypothetical protein
LLRFNEQVAPNHFRIDQFNEKREIESGQLGAVISALVAAAAGAGSHSLHLLRSLTTSDHFPQCSALANSHKSPALVACGFPFWLLLLLLLPLFTGAEFLASTKDNKSTNSEPIDLQ